MIYTMSKQEFLDPLKPEIRILVKKEVKIAR